MTMHAEPEPRIRRARPDDAAPLAAMFARCSPETRYRRFHGLVAAIPAAYLRHCLSGEPGEHRALVAEAGAGAGPRRLVGLASSAPVAGAPDVREVGVLVEDEWQRRGVGGLLFAGLAAHARCAGVTVFRLEMCREQPSLLAYVTGHAEVLAADRSGCDVTVDVAVPDPLSRTPRRAAGTAP